MDMEGAVIRLASTTLQFRILVSEINTETSESNFRRFLLDGQTVKMNWMQTEGWETAIYRYSMQEYQVPSRLTRAFLIQCRFSHGLICHSTTMPVKASANDNVLE